jgi:hypothetical protein
MQAEPTGCPKCHGEMVRGFIFESQGPRRIVSAWVEGAPEKSVLHGAKVDRAKAIPVGVFRCARCGFLESYARPDFMPG